jgi:ATP-binding cassette subfamily B protein
VSDVTAQLHAGENVLAALEVDLDTRLHFVQGLVVVTNERLLSRDGTERELAEWPFRRAWLCATTTMRVSGILNW